MNMLITLNICLDRLNVFSMNSFKYILWREKRKEQIQKIKIQELLLILNVGKKISYCLIMNEYYLEKGAILKKKVYMEPLR